MQGAGGVGGLLAVNTGGATYLPAYDGNGNVISAYDSATGAKAASYEYGPFGEVTKAAGPAADSIPYGFSTKYADSETNLLYYGLRYYSPSTGRWLSRDLIGESGGPNLYGMLLGDPISLVDALGAEPTPAAAPTVPGFVNPAPEDLQSSLWLGEYGKRLLAENPSLEVWQKYRVLDKLSSGCIGVTSVNLGIRQWPFDSTYPETTCFDATKNPALALANAQKAKEEWAKDCRCKDAGPGGPAIFGFRFWSSPKNATSSRRAYRPKTDGGVIGMQGLYSQMKDPRGLIGRPGYINFDFGWRQSDGRWIHANQAETRDVSMLVWTDQWDWEKDRYEGFDRFVICVACKRNELIK
jgi:RHS repeat-associated protein